MSNQLRIATAALLTLITVPAAAQSSLSSWSYDQNVLSMAFASDSPAPADIRQTSYGNTDCGDGCDCSSSVACGSDCACGGGCCVAGFSLAGALGLEDAPVEFGGWTQLGYHSDNTPLSTARGDLLAFNDVPDNLNLQQQWFYIGREADGSNGFDIGGRFDIMYGTDAQKTQAFGNPPGSFDEGWDHGVYGWAIPQLYAEAAVGDFSVKAGHFFTLVGYEVVTAPDNFFYSHALTMFNSEPFTHTGVLGTYTGLEELTLYGGWTAGWDTGFDNLNSGSNFLGGFSATCLDAVTLTYICTWGNFGAWDGGAGDSYGHSVVLDVALTDNLNYVFQTDYTNADRFTTGGDDVGVNQYLFFTLSDACSLGQRLEWWRDGDVSHAASTTGVNVRLLDNLVIRPEYRKDWLGGFDTNIFGMDMILTY